MIQNLYIKFELRQAFICSFVSELTNLNYHHADKKRFAGRN